MSVRLLACLVAASSLLGTGCAFPSGPGRSPLGGIPPSQEAEIGRAAARQVEREFGLVRDPALVAYVREVGARVALRAPRTGVPYRFNVVDVPEPNALALPGGYVYVSRGLLAVANSEDELANVIGHEIAHVAARHASERQSQATGVGLLSILGTVAAGILGGPGAAAVASQLGSVAGAGLIAAYSRDQEREADHLGQEFAASAGADPAAMASFLRTLDALNRLQEAAPRGPGFLDSHPSTPERVAAAASRGVTLSRPGAASRNGASARRRYLDRVEGLLVGENPAEGVIREGLLLHPDLGFALRLPAGWRVRNRHDALGAASPRGDALVLLELQGRGEDPERAARAFARAGGIVFLEAGAERGARLPTYRALTARTTEQGRLAVELIWIAWGGAIYRITGLTPSASYLGHRTQFRAVARSFRPLTDTERAGIRSQRLRLVTAREGETLRDLSARSGNAWNLLETAARNEMRSDTRLVKGTLVKIARAEPYPGRRPAPDGGPER